MSEDVSAAELLFAHQPERHPIVRSGEREPIPWPNRLAILRRDYDICRKCSVGVHSDTAELDHVIPWSAGGSDRSSNLRTLCVTCNQERSNYVDRFVKRFLPATWWCRECVDVDRAYYERSSNMWVFPSHPDHEQCGWCRQIWCGMANDVRAQQRLLKEDGLPMLGWIEALGDEVMAFCAHCDGNRYTRWVL